MDLEALACFVLVADNNGFTAAERRSGQSKATLSRRVRELEDDLGFRLFDRNSRSLRLTDEGEFLHSRVREPLAEIVEVEVAMRAAGDKPHGRLCISAPMLFSELALGAIASSYLAANPDVQIEIITEDRIAAPVEDGFDIIIRVNPDPNTELVGRCILRDRHQVVAAPGLVDRIGSGKVVWPSIVIKDRPEGPWRVNSDGKGIDLDHHAVLRTTSMITSYRAALAGAGIAKVPWFMVAADLEAGRLVRLGEVSQSNVEIWALSPSRRLASRKVTSFLDHLFASFPDRSWPVGAPFQSWSDLR